MDIRRDIVDEEAIDLETDEDIHLFGKIDFASHVLFVSRRGSITIDGKIDNHSRVRLNANGDVRIGVVGDPGDRKIDGASEVTCESLTGSVTIGGKVNSSTVNITAARNIEIGIAGDPGDRKIDHSQVTCVSRGGTIRVNGKVDGGSYVHLAASGLIEIITVGTEDDRKISGKSRVTCVSDAGSIRIRGRVDDESNVSLIAANDVRIAGADEPAHTRIDGRSLVVARAGRTVELAGPILGKRTAVDFQGCRGILISGSIEGGAEARLATLPHRSITVRGPIRSAALVTYWPESSLRAEAGISDATVEARNWVGTDGWCAAGPSLEAYWWQNWPWTFGYVTQRGYPRSLNELVAQVARPGDGIEAVKAVGGGWSFTDAALPCQSAADIERISLLRLGASGRVNVSGVLEGMTDGPSRPMDLWPQEVAAARARATRYDQLATEQRVSSGRYLPAVSGVKIIDTRGMASSLQAQLPSILSESARAVVSGRRFYFHVEAGITIAELNVLLDHQSPRLAIQASGGSPGATLAGTIATATHGGEFRWPLLVDRVRAIHLVGPGGHEWWIEGAESIADPEALRRVYPRIDAAHFIGGGWNSIEGLTAEDVLKAAVVSMGTMGVVYSVVLEVVPQYGIQQIVKPVRDWLTLLAGAGTTEDGLRAGARAANDAVLDFLLDGARNGTGIALDRNVYVDLAINPISRRCWITNRQLTPELPIDSHSLVADVADYLDALTFELERHAAGTALADRLVGRLFDFLSYGREDVHIFNNANQGMRLARFLTSHSDLLATAVATVNVQAVGNRAFGRELDRGHQFLGDVLTGVLNVLSGTTEFDSSDTTGVAYKVGAIGWPDTGVPGRGIEIALPVDQAFSFLQNVLFDDLLTNVMGGDNKPVVGYISIRVCPPTRTLMGMQQFAPYSVMIEVVGYRSPEANALMDLLQQRVLTMVRAGHLSAMLHWGLENDQLTAADLRAMPVRRRLRSGSRFTKLSAFSAIREYLRDGGDPVFDNYFNRRLEL